MAVLISSPVKCLFKFFPDFSVQLVVFSLIHSGYIKNIFWHLCCKFLCLVCRLSFLLSLWYLLRKRHINFNIGKTNLLWFMLFVSCLKFFPLIQGHKNNLIFSSKTWLVLLFALKSFMALCQCLLSNSLLHAKVAVIYQVSTDVWIYVRSLFCSVGLFV